MTATQDYLIPADLLDPSTVAQFDDDAVAADPVVVLNLDHLEELSPDQVGQMRAGHFTYRRIPVGLRTRPLSPSYTGPGQQLLERMATTLVPDEQWQPRDSQLPGGRHSQDAITVRVSDPLAAVERIRGNAAGNVTAALAFDTLFRIAARTTAREGLIAESFAHAMLLGGADYRRWLERLPDAAAKQASAGQARVERHGDVVDIRLPASENGSGLDDVARTRLAHALHEIGPDVKQLRVTTDGPDFWGTARPEGVLTRESIAATYLSRMADNLGAAAYPHRHRMSVQVQGRCVGVGLELAALAHHLAASTDSVFELPQLRMGLVTGHGGTLALTRRLGRWRAAYLALSASPIDAATAYRWHLVDELVD